MVTVIRFPASRKTFKRIGNVAAHPQFRHVRHPPVGYRILTNDRPAGVTLRDLLRIGIRLTDIVTHSAGKVSMWNVARFLLTRELLPFGAGEPIFVPSFPLVIGNEPWFIEIEDLTTLFFPFIHNGKTAAIDIRTHEVFPIVKRLLEHRSCLGILTHIYAQARSFQRRHASSRYHIYPTTPRSCHLRHPSDNPPSRSDCSSTIRGTRTHQIFTFGVDYMFSMPANDSFARVHRFISQYEARCLPKSSSDTDRYFQVRL